MEYPKSAYIHIPFCNSKCYYCAFVSTVNQKLQTGYLISLLKDIDTNYKKNLLSTLYFGGGTPSQIPANYVEKIINKFAFEENPEITFELNPENVTEDYLLCLKKFGINRISIGIQTFNDGILKIIGRRHDSKQALSALTIAKDIGFDNISADLIYGLPNQTISDFKDDLQCLKSLNIPHISLYGLKIEENSIFGKKRPNNLPDDDTQADMYLMATKFLNNYNNYEISNFALSSQYKSRHNLNYWKNSEYYGFGCAAHGYENGIRYANIFDIHKYIENPLLKDFGHTETKEEKLQEEIFLGFRITDGINVENINQKYEINFEKKYEKVLSKYLNTGYIIKTNNGYKLTDNGLLISTVILADFI